MKIDFHPDAFAELSDALEWYLNQSPAAARNFAIEIDQAIQKITDTPERFVVVGRNYRACSVVRFPYQIIYRVTADQIRVIAVAHAKRRPNYWKRRI